MNNLQDEVAGIITDFIFNDQLFTALDVSNKVKVSMPLATHREVRDVVRQIFSDGMNGWDRSVIKVTLADGSQQDTFLYHSYGDTDLDNKYDAQKRTTTAVKSTVVPATVSNNVATVTPTANIPTTPVSASQLMRDKWNGLFGDNPSLFPRKGV